jgi:hypothetical protein
MEEMLFIDGTTGDDINTAGNESMNWTVMP